MNQPGIFLGARLNFETMLTNYIDRFRKYQNRGGYYDTLHKYGVVFNVPEKLQPDYVEPGEKKQCFKNSTRLVSAKRERYVYCEGVAINAEFLGLPIEHGWVYDLQTNQIIDLTWDDGVEYYGIPFKYDFYLSEHILKEEFFGGTVTTLAKYLHENPGTKPDLFLHNLLTINHNQTKVA